MCKTVEDVIADAIEDETDHVAWTKETVARGVIEALEATGFQIVRLVEKKLPPFTIEDDVS